MYLKKLLSIFYLLFVIKKICIKPQILLERFVNIYSGKQNEQYSILLIRS